MSRGPDAATLLARALAASAEAARCPVTIALHDIRRWASVTFSGMRHQLRIEAPMSPQLDTWLATLPDAEFALRGHLVADLTIEAIRRADGRATAEIEVLTVEER
jgi:hypothetical protein